MSVPRPPPSCWALLFFASFATGCLAPPPRILVESDQGVVRADSGSQGRLAAQLLEELAPRVRDRLTDTLPGPLEVWVQRELAVYRGWTVDSQVPAFTVEGHGRIHMLEGDRVELSAALAHELVHAMLGPTWATLPPVAEEGLADWIQEELNTRIAHSLRADHLAKASGAVGGLQFALWTSRDSQRGRRLATFTFPKDLGSDRIDPLKALDRHESAASGLFQPYQVAVSDPRLYGIGYLVVSRIAERHGIDALNALCVRARKEGLERVPGDWLLAEAGLEGGSATWRRIITERIRFAELMALGRQLVPDLVRLVVDTVGPRSGASSGPDFLSRVRPVFGLVDGEMRIPLSTVPGFSDALWAAWPRASKRTGGVTPDEEGVFWATPPTPPGASSPAPEASPVPASSSRRPLP